MFRVTLSLLCAVAGAAHARGFSVGDGARRMQVDLLQPARAAWRVDEVDGGRRDFVSLAQDPGRVTYQIDLGDSVAGLRAVGGVIELIDASGTPRLRVANAAIVSADGASHPARLSVRGCAVDRNPAPPWGRAPIAPGSRRCLIDVEWDGPVAFPAVLDPSWTTTHDMSEPHSNHDAEPLPGGRVLVIGGDTQANGAVAPTATCEIYDPDTDTWAVTDALSAPLSDFSGVALLDGSVLVAGGCSAGCTAWPDPQRYDSTQGKWAAAGPAEPFVGGVLVLLADGRALRAGGGDSHSYMPLASAQLYDPTSNTWTATARMHEARGGAVGTRLSDGRVLVVGGQDDAKALLTSTEIYDPASGTWSGASPMPSPRAAMTLTPSGAGALLAGGWVVDYPFTLATDALLFDPGSNAWTQAPLVWPRDQHTALLLPDGSVLVAGGENSAGQKLALVERWDPTSRSWSSLPGLATGRTWPTATLCTKEGHPAVLVAGGIGPTDWLSSAELLILDGADMGPPIDQVPPDGGADLGSDGGISLMRTPGDRATGCNCSYTSAPSAAPLGLLLALIFVGLIARHTRRRRNP